jgi:hypothetical protein
VSVLESVARVAGGAVGMSGFIHELAKTGYLQGVNFFSSIIVPELRTQLVSDLNGHIRNLGDMAMDTVVILQPSESYDRYVFFPRDPIYNFPDEYDPVSPAYIAKIDGDELLVEAVPIEGDKIARGGSKDAQSLVSRALNEGEKSVQAQLLEQAGSQAKLRSVELGNLLARIDVLMAAAGEDAAAKQRAKSEISRQVALFLQYFGAENSGALALQLQKYGMSSTDRPPDILPVRQLELAWGTNSLEQELAVVDDNGTANLTLTGTAEAPLKYVAKSGLRYTLSVDPKGKDDEARAELKLKVEDKGGNAAAAVQPVILREPSVTWGQADTTLSNSAKIEIPANENFALEVRAVFKDSDPSALVCSVTLGGDTKLKQETLISTEVLGDGKTLRARFRLLPQAPAISETITVEVKNGDKTVVKKSIQMSRPSGT